MLRKSVKKRYLSLLTVVCLSIMLFPYLSEKASALQEQVHTATRPSASPNPPNESSTMDSKDSPTVKTSSYVMLNVQTGEKLLASDENVKRPPASTLKLLTGIVALEKLKEDDVIQVGDEVRNTEGSQIGLQPGDKIQVKDLLTALYLESANDAAYALAVAAQGSIVEFSKAMNQHASKLGCTNSEFHTPNGLPHPNQYTTAEDLAKISLEFLQKDDLMKYVKMKQAVVEWTRSNGIKMKQPIKNTNQLLGIYPGDEGLKTGTTTEAGQCLVTYLTRPDGDYLLILLGSENRYKETVDLLDEGVAKIRSRLALKNITNHPDALVTMPGFFSP